MLRKEIYFTIIGKFTALFMCLIKDLLKYGLEYE